MLSTCYYKPIPLGRKGAGLPLVKSGPSREDDLRVQASGAQVYISINTDYLIIFDLYICLYLYVSTYIPPRR